MTPITVWVALNNKSNSLQVRKYDGIYINLHEMYQITVACSVKHFTCYIKGELHNYEKYFVTLSCLQCTCCRQNAQHLTVIQAFVLDELVLLTKEKIVGSTHLCYHEVISVVITNFCCRNGEKSHHDLSVGVSLRAGHRAN